MEGHCLCQGVAFELAATRLRLYQCHCSLCRRQSGALSNTASIVPRADFRWLRGEALRRSFQGDRGFRSDFCDCCGSPLPNPLRDLPFMWIPAGLLEDVPGLVLTDHLCLDSRAAWDPGLLPGMPGHGYGGLPPDLDAFIAYLGFASPALPAAPDAPSEPPG